MGWISRIGIIVGVALVATSLEQEARACSCYGDSQLVAPVGDQHPRNASLLFQSFCGGSMASWSVTVDGQPASLMTGQGWSVHDVDIVPSPAVGAEVVLSQSCIDAYDAPECDTPETVVERARFVVGDDDVQAPPAVADVVLDQERGDYNIGCDESTLDTRFVGTIELDASEPGTWVDVVFYRGDTEIERNGFTIPPSGVIESAVYSDQSDLDGSEICVSAQVLDAAGNASESLRDCVQTSGCGCDVDAGPLGSSLALFGVVLLRRRRLVRRLGATCPRQMT